MRRVLIALLLTMSAAGSGVAGTWRVEQDGSGQFTTLQPAVDAAASGDTILVGPGWYQELHWVDHYGSPIQVAAYWTDAKDMVFIGAGASEVTIGPASYSQYRDGPQGIYYEGPTLQTVSVSGMSFVNLYVGVMGTDLLVRRCSFVGGGGGVVAVRGSSAVSDCEFVGQEISSCRFFSCQSVEVSNCSLGAYVYLGDTANGIVRNNTADGRALCYFYNSDGLVEGNTTDCYTGSFSEPVVGINAGSIVTVRNNTIIGGWSGLTIDDPGTFVQIEGNLVAEQDYGCILLRLGATLVATANDFRRPFLGGYLIWCAEFRTSGSPVTISMENNYWNYQHADLISRYIWDFNDDPDLKVIIDFEPFAGGSVPAKEESWGSLKAMFLDP